MRGFKTNSSNSIILLSLFLKIISSLSVSDSSVVHSDTGNPFHFSNNKIGTGFLLTGHTFRSNGAFLFHRAYFPVNKKCPGRLVLLCTRQTRTFQRLRDTSIFLLTPQIPSDHRPDIAGLQPQLPECRSGDSVLLYLLHL